MGPARCLLTSDGAVERHLESDGGGLEAGPAHEQLAEGLLARGSPDLGVERA